MTTKTGMRVRIIPQDHPQDCPTFLLYTYVHMYVCNAYLYVYTCVCIYNSLLFTYLPYKSIAPDGIPWNTIVEELCQDQHVDL
jgi:hypothetical protein